MKMRKFLLFFLILCNFGCKTIQPISTDTRNDSAQVSDRNHYERDSIYVRDSIYIHDKGDTVWVDRWHMEYKEITIADTIRDTIKVVRRQKVVEQVKYIPKWAWWSLVVCIALVAGIVARIVIKIKTGR